MKKKRLFLPLHCLLCGIARDQTKLGGPKGRHLDPIDGADFLWIENQYANSADIVPDGRLFFHLMRLILKINSSLETNFMRSFWSVLINPVGWAVTSVLIWKIVDLSFFFKWTFTKFYSYHISFFKLAQGDERSNIEENIKICDKLGAVFWIKTTLSIFFQIRQQEDVSNILHSPEFM